MPTRASESSKLDSRTLHGRKLAFRRAGKGPTLLLIHGITNSSQSWEPAIRLLRKLLTWRTFARKFT